MASIERFDSLFRRDQKKMPSKLITVQITQNSLEGFFFPPSAGTTFTRRDQYTRFVKNFSRLDVPSIQKGCSLALIYHWIISEEWAYQHLTPLLYLPRTSRIHWGLTGPKTQLPLDFLISHINPYRHQQGSCSTKKVHSKASTRSHWKEGDIFRLESLSQLMQIPNILTLTWKFIRAWCPFLKTSFP